MNREPPEIRGTGYVVASLEAALWEFAKSRSFEAGAPRSAGELRGAADERRELMNLGRTTRNAIYIDFEALKTPQSAALLGILSDIDGKREFEQIVLDARLRSAAVARPQLRVATLEEMVTRILASGLPLIGWSLFDRDVMLAANISSQLKEQCRERYVNALQTARTWRTKVHPSFKISADRKFDPQHTLDKYAALAGYPGLKILKGASPAKWIRHLVEQLNARGRYRDVTRQTRRDWHALLEYNRHDCLALRHIFLRVSFELAKWRDYESTTYCVYDEPKRRICFRVGSTSARLDALLERVGATRWAFITAWNPGSEMLAQAANDSRQTDLISQLTAAGYRCLAGEGRGDDPSWPPEESALTLDIPERAARRFGRSFGQLAVIVGRRGRPARLVACSP